MEHDQRTQELGLALLGPEGATTVGAAGQWTYGFLANRCLTIAGGTSEIQRNVIGEPGSVNERSRRASLPPRAKWSSSSTKPGRFEVDGGQAHRGRDPQQPGRGAVGHPHLVAQGEA